MLEYLNRQLLFCVCWMLHNWIAESYNTNLIKYVILLVNRCFICTLAQLIALPAIINLGEIHRLRVCHNTTHLQRCNFPFFTRVYDCCFSTRPDTTFFQRPNFTQPVTVLARHSSSKYHLLFVLDVII